jgi:hypothetical protein
VQGDQIGAYDLWLKIPEAFSRHFSEQRYLANFINNLSYFIGVFGFFLAAAVILGVHIMNHGRPRRSPFIVATMVAVLSLLTGLNLLPLYKASYNTTQAYGQYWLEILIYGAIGGVGLFCYILILWWGGERVSKLAWPRQDKVLPLEGDRWINLGRSAWRGLMLSGLMGAYVVLFYLVATRLFGSWTPVDVDYSDIYATPFLCRLWPRTAACRSGRSPLSPGRSLLRPGYAAPPLAGCIDPWRAVGFRPPGLRDRSLLSARHRTDHISRFSGRLVLLEI